MDVLEGRERGEGPATMVRRLALAKALSVSKLRSGRWVLGADTTVAVGKRVLEKPSGPREARRMLRALEDREHEVWTGVALVKDGRPICVFTERTWVRFGKIPTLEMRAYLGSGAPYDKAGGYDIQGKAGDWIAGIRGDFFNVMGLPLSRTLRELRKRGFGG